MAVAPSTKPATEARKWKKELQLAKKREKEWVAEAEKIIKRYRGEERKKNRFNVLWSNTEILRPAIYNSRPNPDVRRRFRDADPVGKAVSEVLERSLLVFVDGDEFDSAVRNDVLDGLLSGRGVSRIRYVPKITQLPPKTKKAETEETGGSSDPIDDPDEELEAEYVCGEHVDWRDYREGYGRVWAEVPWTAYRYKLTRPEAQDKFAKEDLVGIQFTTPDKDDPNHPGDQVGETQKIAEFWEVWDKLGNKVFFVQEELEVLLYPKDNEAGEPPLTFDGFFPSPDPIRIIEDTGSRLPIPLFRLYEEQANELDKISGRIDKIVNAMRLRGVYDSRLSELPDLLAKDDNELTPVANAAMWLDGGLDKAITWMPVEKAAALLVSLYDARDRQKAIIDEILGISDILRGATDPNETLGAQQLKSNYASVRLQRMQKEVQRYTRDLLRLAAGAMAQKFSPETFHAMTELNFPTAEQKQMLQMQVQQQQMQAMAQQAQLPATPPGMPPGAPQGAPGPAPQGPPIDPKMLQMPTWEDILGVMRSDKRRQYTIDVETDSTIAGTLSSDMAGLSQVLKAVSDTITGLAPLVQDGALPIDAAKELVMAVIRRSRMGLAVEDAFDKMTAPKPPPDPNAGKAQAAVAQTQTKAEADIKVAQIKADLDAHVAQVQQAAQAQQNAQEQMLEEHREQQKAQREDWQTKLDAAVKIIVAQIGAKQAVDTATIAAANSEATTDL